MLKSVHGVLLTTSHMSSTELSWKTGSGVLGTITLQRKVSCVFLVRTSPCTECGQVHMCGLGHNPKVSSERHLVLTGDARALMYSLVPFAQISDAVRLDEDVGARFRVCGSDRVRTRNHLVHCNCCQFPHQRVNLLNGHFSLPTQVVPDTGFLWSAATEALISQSNDLNRSSSGSHLYNLQTEFDLLVFFGTVVGNSEV